MMKVARACIIATLKPSETGTAVSAFELPFFALYQTCDHFFRRSSMTQAERYIGDLNQQLSSLQSSIPGVSRARLLRHIVTITIRDSLVLHQHRAARLLDRIISSSRNGVALDPDIPLCKLPELQLDKILENESKYTEAVRIDVLEAIRRHPDITLRSLNIFGIEALVAMAAEADSWAAHGVAPGGAAVSAASVVSAARLTPDSLKKLSAEEVAEAATRRAGISPPADCVQATKESGVKSLKYREEWKRDFLKDDLQTVEYFRANAGHCDRIIEALVAMAHEADYFAGTAPPLSPRASLPPAWEQFTDLHGRP
jgi:hypothetical protein